MDPFKVLIEVVKHKSYTKAAKKLYTSQPSVSRDIKRLETKYNVKVFEFQHSHMTLTSAGEKLFHYALQKQRLEERLNKDLQQSPHTISGEITVGCSYTYGEYRLAEHLADLTIKYPNLHVHVHLDNSENVMDQLKNNAIDIGIVEKEIHDNLLNRMVIEHDEMVLIKSKGHPLVKDRFYIREFGSGTRAYQEKGIEQLQINPSLIEINNTTLIKNLVGRGLGISIVSSATLTPFDNERLSVEPLNIFRDFYILTHINKYIDDKLELLMTHLKA